MQIRFDAESHTYFNDKGYIVPSTTEVLGAVYGTGLENAPAYFVERAAEEGTDTHTEFNLWHEGKIAEKDLTKSKAKSAVAWFKSKNFKYSKSEFIGYAKNAYGEICGTIDLFADGYIYDFKTSRTATRKQIEKWQQQLSIYAYVLRQEKKSVLGVKVVRITDDEGCEEIPLEILGDDFVEETMRLYSEGKRAEEKQATTALESVSQKELLVFADRLKRIKALEEEIAGVKEIIQAEMEKRNILALEVGDVSITYVSPTTRKSFDSTKFKAEHADLYKQYQKESSVKGCIKIKVK